MPPIFLIQEIQLSMSYRKGLILTLGFFTQQLKKTSKQGQ